MKDTKEKWFQEAKFGLFIHFGLFSVLEGEYKGKRTPTASGPSTAEWIMSYMQIPVEAYEKIAKKFNPVNFDADFIVKKAKSWGMKYITFTAKHHEGFAMYHSTVDPYNSYDATPCKRDFVKELADACKKYGMKFCLYYSQVQDWHDTNGFWFNKDNKGKDFNTYLNNKCIPQIKELLTNYGEIGAIWFDSPLNIEPEQSKKLVDLVKKLQPHCIVSGRIGNNLGDYFSTGDNQLPSGPIKDDWEVPATLNDTWGFDKFDTNWKDSQKILELLVKINSRGGNYLLNIGPDATGAIPQASLDILNKIGAYVHENEDALFATRAVFDNPYEQSYGLLTEKDYKLFLHVLYHPVKEICLKNLSNHIRNISIVSTGEALKYSIREQNRNSNSSLNITLPSSYHKKTNYCICIHYEEKEAIFEPLKN